jgi:hypothetical protein
MARAIVGEEAVRRAGVDDDLGAALRRRERRPRKEPRRGIPTESPLEFSKLIVGDPDARR